MATKTATQTKTLERGDIYFFYRPRVEDETPQGRSDIQRFYIALSPRNEKHFRLMVIGRKRLPVPSESGRERFWGFVDMVRKDPRAVRRELGATEYGTKTRGERHLPAARPAGEGVYRIVLHTDHTHLAYALELPKEPGEVQEELKIEPEASYIISVKNPEAPTPPSAGLEAEKKADYPKTLLKYFEGRKFINADPPALLDHEGAQFLLVSASEDVKEDIGIDLKPEDESETSADVIRSLGLDRQSHHTRPLVKGEWE